MKKRTSKPPVPSLKPQPLTHIVSWSHRLACEVLSRGGMAVDLTAGKGRDTFALAKTVGPEGQVLAFDLQAAALEQTTGFLQANDLLVTHWPPDQELPEQPGIFLTQTCHSNLGNVLRHPAQAVIANLGYLPGGDHQLITRPDSTLAALGQSLELLAPGGRLVVTVYHSHPGGGEEGDAVNAFFSNLPVSQWRVLLLRAANHAEAPYLFAAERLA